MSGITEILLIVAIVLGIFTLPRLLAGKADPRPDGRKATPPISGRMRVAILASLLWPVLLAFFLKPWNDHWVTFLYFAIGPVGLIWGIYWVVAGFKKNKYRA